MSRQTRLLAALTGLLIFGSAGAAWADNVVADGDGAAPITGNGLTFGTVCQGAPVTKPALITVQRNGSSSGPTIFANSAVVTIAVTGVTGTGVSTSPASGSIGTVTLPSNWSSRPNNTTAGSVSLTVQLAAATAGPVGGSVTMSATAGSVVRTTSLPITATVVNCDTTPPVLHLPGPLIAEAAGPDGATVSFSSTSDDESPAHPAVTCDHASGDTYPLGTTTVHCTATDAAGNTTTGQFTISTVDTTGPVMGAAVNLTGIEATSAAGATVPYAAPSATDTVSGPVPVACAPASGATFPLGTSTVTCTAADAAGNSTQRTFAITIQDTQAPALAVPDDMTAEATSAQGAVVAYPAASAQDIVDGALTPACAPASGSSFPLGATEVTCIVTDASGNNASKSFHVTVQDTTPPALISAPSNVTLEATGPSGVTAAFTPPTATDLVDGAVAVQCLPASGSTFPLGTTAVTCSATDAAGNTASTSHLVTVQDTTAPDLTLPADQVISATSPDGATAAFSPEASDLVDGAVAVQCVPAAGSTFPIGTTEVTCSATDRAGNTAQGSFKVNVRRTITGFYQPVEMSRVLNTVKGGSTVPLKFEVFAGSVEATSTSIISTVSLKQFNCDPNAALDPVDLTATGSTSLRYDAVAGQYVYNWQTPKTKGQCYQAAVSTVDGATVLAQFKTF